MHLAQYLTQAVKRFPEATAVVDDQVRWSYRDLYSEVTADASLSGEELDQFCLAHPHLARFKRPRRYVFIKEVPKSPVGKILRRKLQAGDYDLYDVQLQ